MTLSIEQLIANIDNAQTYRTLQQALKAYRETGYQVTCKLNAKREVLDQEATKIFAQYETETTPARIIATSKASKTANKTVKSPAVTVISVETVTLQPAPKTTPKTQTLPLPKVAKDTKFTFKQSQVILANELSFSHMQGTLAVATNPQGQEILITAQGVQA
jgi:hypothetical protein